MNNKYCRRQPEQLLIRSQEKSQKRNRKKQMLHHLSKRQSQNLSQLRRLKKELPLELLGLPWQGRNRKRLMEREALLGTIRKHSSHRSRRSLSKWLSKSVRAKRSRSIFYWKVKSLKRNQPSLKKTQSTGKDQKLLTRRQRSTSLTSFIKNSKRQRMKCLTLLISIFLKCSPLRHPLPLIRASRLTTLGSRNCYLNLA